MVKGVMASKIDCAYPNEDLFIMGVFLRGVDPSCLVTAPQSVSVMLENGSLIFFVLFCKRGTVIVTGDVVLMGQKRLGLLPFPHLCRGWLERQVFYGKGRC